jgi:hypothetical protein
VIVKPKSSFAIDSVRRPENAEIELRDCGCGANSEWRAFMIAIYDDGAFRSGAKTKTYSIE